MTTASSEELGDIHKMLTETYKRLVAPREEVIMSRGEPLLDEDGNPRTYTVYPTAAELAAANTFLKNNNIVAATGNTDAIRDLQALMEKRRNSTLRAVLPDPMETMPPSFGLN